MTIFERIINEYENAGRDNILIILFELLCEDYNIPKDYEYLDAHILNFDNVDDYINDVIELNK